MIIMSDKVLPEMFNNNFDEDEDQTATHSPKTEITEAIGFQTNKDGKDEQNVFHPSNTELTETIGVQTMKDGKIEQHATHPPKPEMTETTSCQTMRDGKIEQDETQPPKIEMEEIIGPKNKKDGVQCSMSDIESPSTENKKSQDDSEQLQRKVDTNAIHHPKIDMTETIGLKTMEDGEEGQNATHPPNTERTESVEFQIMMDGVQCSMLDIESSNTVNKKPQDDCKKIQRTHDKLKNKNKKLRKSVIDMDRTLSQEKNLVSHLQEREKHLVSEIENANAINKQLHSNCEMLQSTNTKIVKENKMLQKSVQDKDQSLSREMKTVSDLQERGNHLVSELENANAMNNQLHINCEALQSTNNKLLKENKMLQESIEDKDQSLSNERKTVSDLQKSTNNKLLKENKMLQESIQHKDQSLSKERKTVSDLQKRVESLVLELGSTNTVNKQLHSDIETLQNMYYNIQIKNEQLEKSLKEMDRDLFQEKETVSELQKRLEIMQNQVQTYHQRESRLKEAYDNEVLKSGIQKKQICDLQVQRHDSLNRLSKLAGDILTHENTNIADLSDENRPTKLSETYSELYDNEWTDAFEELTGRDLTDIHAVGKLLDMLLLSFRKCREVTWERYQSLKSTMSTIDIVHVLPSRGELTELEEKIKTTSTESDLSSHHEKYNNISINSEPQNKESEAKEVVETSEPMELEHQREQHGEQGTEMVTMRTQICSLIMSMGTCLCISTF